MAWRSLSANRAAMAGLCVIVLLVLVAGFADLLAPYDPDQQYRDALLKPPAWISGDWRYVLGTDDVGRDVLSRLLHGGRLSLAIGVVVVTLALLAGGVLGLTAGYVGGLWDLFVMRMMDVLMALPGLLLALVLVAILGPSLMNAMLAIAVVMLPGFVRLTRAAALTEMPRPYIDASRVAGVRPSRLMLRSLLPNCLPPLIVQSTLGFSVAVLDTAALGFLGMGAQPPTAEWGTMLAGSLQFVQSAWWLVGLPGLAILITVLAFNLMGDALRAALDPRLRK
jgi:dipeptide transport system permease protein